MVIVFPLEQRRKSCLGLEEGRLRLIFCRTDWMGISSILSRPPSTFLEETSRTIQSVAFLAGDSHFLPKLIAPILHAVKR